MSFAFDSDIGFYRGTVAESELTAHNYYDDALVAAASAFVKNGTKGKKASESAVQTAVIYNTTGKNFHDGEKDPFVVLDDIVKRIERETATKVYVSSFSDTALQLSVESPTEKAVKYLFKKKLAAHVAELITDEAHLAIGNKRFFSVSTTYQDTLLFITHPAAYVYDPTYDDKHAVLSGSGRASLARRGVHADRRVAPTVAIEVVALPAGTSDDIAEKHILTTAGTWLKHRGFPDDLYHARAVIVLALVGETLLVSAFAANARRLDVHPADPAAPRYRVQTVSPLNADYFARRGTVHAVKGNQYDFYLLSSLSVDLTSKANDSLDIPLDLFFKRPPIGRKSVIPETVLAKKCTLSAHDLRKILRGALKTV